MAMEQAGMGVGVGDYDLDGHLDLFKTHFVGDTSGFYRNDGKGNFDDVTRAAKIGVETRFICWGAGMVDLDNDGYPDLLHGHRQRLSGSREESSASILTRLRAFFFATWATAPLRNWIDAGRPRSYGGS